jgi:hypothetical protein
MFQALAFGATSAGFGQVFAVLLDGTSSDHDRPVSLLNRPADLRPAHLF